MINKSLGKLHKVRAQGEDNQGNSYQSLEEMWRSQLDPAYIEAKKENGNAAAASSNPESTTMLPTAGDKGTWY